MDVGTAVVEATLQRRAAKTISITMAAAGLLCRGQEAGLLCPGREAVVAVVDPGYLVDQADRGRGEQAHLVPTVLPQVAKVAIRARQII